MIRRVLTVFVLALLVILAGCSQSQLTITLTALTDVTSASSVLAIGLCGSGVIPANACTVLLPSLSGVAQATPQISAELESNDSLATQVSKCIAILTPLIIQDVPGIPPLYQGIISDVNLGIQALVTELQKLLPAAKALDVAGAKHPTPVPMAWKDRSAIRAAVKKSAATVTMISTWRSTHK